MNIKLSEILIGLFFAGLIIGTGFMQTQLKNESQIYMMLFGILTLVSLLAEKSLKTPIPFYIFFGILIFTNIFIVTNLIVNLINPYDGWSVNTNGERVRVMQMNWIWGVLVGLVLSPLTIFLYNKKRNKMLEISFTTIFIILTVIIYIKYELL